MELATDEPRMDIRWQLDHFAQIGPRRTPGNFQALFFELCQQNIVNFVAVTMAFGNLGLAVDLTGQ